ncbi:phosphate signaling complex protein PhoU [Thiomicrorhabdus sp. ZW0627]|uniref:phosphate signaling complex protein PhoU n=1 Tax=Thiomicrorhabdus sp. ZW0627 TaxID=3039774 RepID=UPI002436789B|nr:phosphate signaling complex protein PhoU [Thiomicrorhabdus sp. ZW0627]MDG6773537.1 phosphate signaling complex protein PhoU [Thiomicrorhabdus sp. ZW0627]
MERTEFKSHISEQLNRNLEDLFNQVLEMGGLVERQLENAVTAVENSDVSLAKEVLQIDKVINKEEMEIDRLCARVLARQQPTASDLRLIIIAIRIAVDLERMGDEVVKTAKLVIKMADSDVVCSELPGYGALLEITSCANTMLKKVLNAFARLELSEVVSVVEDEERMDNSLKAAMVDVLAGFNAHEIAPEYLLEMVYALRASERVTDHAANIAESIVYLVDGRDVRNMDTEKLSELLSSIE